MSQKFVQSHLRQQLNGEHLRAQFREIKWRWWYFYKKWQYLITQRSCLLPDTGHSQFQAAPKDPPQGTGGPLSRDGDALGKADLRTWRTLQNQWGLRKKAWEKKQLCIHQGQRRMIGRGCCRCWNRDSPEACGEDHGEAHYTSAACGRPWWSRYMHCSLWRTPHCSRWMCHEGICELMESPHWSRLLAGTVSHAEEPKQEKIFWK